MNRLLTVPKTRTRRRRYGKDLEGVWYSSVVTTKSRRYWVLNTDKISWMGPDLRSLRRVKETSGHSGSPVHGVGGVGTEVGWRLLHPSLDFLVSGQPPDTHTPPLSWYPFSSSTNPCPSGHLRLLKYTPFYPFPSVSRVSELVKMFRLSPFLWFYLFTILVHRVHLHSRRVTHPRLCLQFGRFRREVSPRPVQGPHSLPTSTVTHGSSLVPSRHLLPSFDSSWGLFYSSNRSPSARSVEFDARPGVESGRRDTEGHDWDLPYTYDCKPILWGRKLYESFRRSTHVPCHNRPERHATLVPTPQNNNN